MKKTLFAAAVLCAALTVNVSAETLPEVITEGKVCQESVDRIYAVSSELPEEVVNEFCESGWKFCLTERGILDTIAPGVSEPANSRSDAKNKTIYIADTSDAIDESVRYEFGSFLEAHNMVSTSKEFMDIYEKEIDAFHKYFGVDPFGSAWTYFSSSFEKYYGDSTELMQTICPETCDFLDEVVAGLGDSNDAVA